LCFLFSADSTRCQCDFTRKGKDKSTLNNGAISPQFLDQNYSHALRMGMLRLLLLALFSVTNIAFASADVEKLLARSIIDSNLPLAEVQAFTESRVPLMPKVSSSAEWTRIADSLRKDTLDKVVFRGEAAKWRKLKTKVVWLETIDGGPEYRIRKLRYEAVPGMWIPALLYEPISLEGKVPVAMHVNGHEGVGKSVPYKQIRCINLAKRGMLVLNLEWIGMGQLRGTNYGHYRMNQLDLCGTSGVSSFYLAMKRGLDILLEHKNADPARVEVSGLSGGGWQTIFISSLDTRVTLANPVAGYSSFRTRARFFSDLGDSEQTPCDLATVADYAHLTAMMAPRPLLLTMNQTDNCCFAAPHAMPPLLEAALPIYELFGKRQNLRAHINHVPGDHNYGPDNREALYRMIGEHFYDDDSSFIAMETECESEVKDSKLLDVELPNENADFNSIALALAKDLPRRKAELSDVIRATNYYAQAERVAAVDTATYWKLHLNGAWTVPCVELKRGEPASTTIIFSENGRRSLAKEVATLLDAGKRVIAIDPFYYGESKIRTHDFLFALLVAAVGERPLGIQASQIAAAARWAETEFGKPVELTAVGPRSSLVALCASALEKRAISSLDTRDSFSSLKEILEKNMSVDKAPELFCFGLLESFDIPRLRALSSK
jgi:cephalosporin-C deacetylase-like acetyl esterase